MNEIISGHSFSVDSGVATHCGVNAALIYNHICFWIKVNSAKPECWINGKVWMYQTHKQISDHFEFLSEDQICRALKVLFEQGLLIKDNFNKNPFDRTSWFSLPDTVFKKMVTKPQNRNIQSQQSQNVCCEPADSYIRKKDINKKNINKNIAAETSDLPDAEIQKTITPIGQEISIEESVVYMHFLNSDFSKSIISRAIAIVKQTTTPVGDILKLIEAICLRLMKSQYTPPAPTRKQFIDQGYKDPRTASFKDVRSEPTITYAQFQERERQERLARNAKNN